MRASGTICQSILGIKNHQGIFCKIKVIRIKIPDAFVTVTGIGIIKHIPVSCFFVIINFIRNDNEHH